MSSTQARTTSPTSWRRASRPSESAITRIASCGWMKQRGIASPGYEGQAECSVGVRVDGIASMRALPCKRGADARGPGAGGRKCLAPAALDRGCPLGGSDAQNGCDICGVRLRSGAEAVSGTLGPRPIRERQVERFEGHGGSFGESRGAAVEQQGIADPEHALGGPRRPAPTPAPPAGGQLPRVRAPIVDLEAPEAGEQLVARRTAEARQCEAFEQPREATIGRPCRIAAEGGRPATPSASP